MRTDSRTHRSRTFAAVRSCILQACGSLVFAFTVYGVPSWTYQETRGVDENVSLLLY